MAASDSNSASNTASNTAIKPQRLKGFRDFLPAQMMLRQRVISTVRALFERHGFAPLDTPALEYLETLTGKYGDEERLLYKFQDQGERHVGLRYDLTVPLARVIGMNAGQLTFPFKRYHIAPVWRAENPQKGRYREFYQCDADIVGSSSTLADAEVVSILVEAMELFGFPGYEVLVYNRKLLTAMARYAGVPDAQAGQIYRALDKLAKIGNDGVLAEMDRYGVPAEAARRALDLATEGRGDDNETTLARLESRLAGDAEAQAGVRELRDLITYLGALTPAAGKVRIDPTLARGLDYYTGPIWEVEVQEPKVGSLGSGGRYDKLVGMFSGRDLPTTGCSLGLERIIDVMESLGTWKSDASASQVFVAVFSPDQLLPALSLLAELRVAGLRAESTLSPDDKLGKQLQYADRVGIPLAVIVAPDEWARGEILVKQLRTGEQRTLPRAEAAPALAALLAESQS
jgi:histidyl-tRNA synthetase